MLPTFPLASEKARAWLFEHLNKRIQHHLGFFADMPKRSIREGDETSLISPSGVENKVEFHTIKVESSWVKGEDGHIPIQEALKHIESMASQLAHERNRLVFHELNTQLTPDRIIDATDRKFDGKLIEEAMENLAIEFDDNDEPIMPTWVTSPETAKMLMAQAAIESDPESKKRMDLIIAKKRREFHARKTDKRLVN